MSLITCSPSFSITICISLTNTSAYHIPPSRYNVLLLLPKSDYSYIYLIHLATKHFPLFQLHHSMLFRTSHCAVRAAPCRYHLQHNFKLFHFGPCHTLKREQIKAICVFHRRGIINENPYKYYITISNAHPIINSL